MKTRIYATPAVEGLTEYNSINIFYSPIGAVGISIMSVDVNWIITRGYLLEVLKQTENINT